MEDRDARIVFERARALDAIEHTLAFVLRLRVELQQIVGIGREHRVNLRVRTKRRSIAGQQQLTDTLERLVLLHLAKRVLDGSPLERLTNRREALCAVQALVQYVIEVPAAITAAQHL